MAEIPCGTEGLTGSKNVSGLHPGYLSEATNISFYDGTVRKEGGASKYNSSAISGTPVICGGWDHRTNALAQRMIVATAAGVLYKDSGAGTFPVTLKSGLSAAMRPYFVEGGKEAAAGNRKTFIFTGTNVVQVLVDDGATTSDISAPPTDWATSNQPTFGLIHAGRLWGFGNANDPHRAYASLATNHEDFTTTPLTFSIFAGEGEALVAGVSFQGLIVLFKRPFGVYVVDTRDASSSNWYVKRVTRSVGMSSPWALVETENDVIFMDSTGAIQSLAAVQEFGDVAGRNLSQQSFMEPLMRSELNMSRLSAVRAVYYSHRREVHFAYSTAGSSVNNARLVLDLYHPQKIRYRISTRDVCESLWLRQDSSNIYRVMAGDNAGFVWLLDTASRNKDGSAYVSKAVTVPTDLGFTSQEIAHREKNACFLELIYEPTTFNNVNVTLVWDEIYRETISFSLSGAGAILGTSFILGSAILGGAGYVSTIERITGGGKFLSLIFEGNGLNQDFSIARARLYFTLGNE